MITVDITTRQLNRTYLQRQHLLTPFRGTVSELVGHLVAVQAQETDAPYIGLWARMVASVGDKSAVSATFGQSSCDRIPA